MNRIKWKHYNFVKIISFPGSFTVSVYKIAERNALINVLVNHYKSMVRGVMVDMNDQFYSQNIFCSPQPGPGVNVTKLAGTELTTNKVLIKLLR